ncbi:MAG: response regulator [Chloroflexi bacterium]|nr:response regulator [Chloroflexota bacterium]
MRTARHPAKPGRHVLVIDDDPSLRELYRVILLEEGFSVLTAADGQEGLEKLAKSHPDLILVDLAMPRMDGVEFCQRLRHTSSYDEVPIIVVSAQSDIWQKAREIGANGCLGKPFELDEFLTCVGKAVTPRAA